MKKRVHSSNLNLRFYKGHGWARENLEPYLLKGALHDTQFTHHKDPPGEAYFILAPGGRLDVNRLYENEVSDVVRAYDDYPNETDLEFLGRFNW